MAAQLPDEEKIKAADYIIDNSGSLDETQAKVKRFSRNSGPQPDESTVQCQKNLQSVIDPCKSVAEGFSNFMRLFRPVVFALIFAGAFFYFTTYRPVGGTLTSWISRPAKVEITEAASSSDNPLDAEEQNNIDVYRKNIASVVNVKSRAVTFDFFYGLVPEEGQGSGFIIDKAGHVLTNYHVIADARQVEVVLHNRKSYKATIVGTDRSHDLAVLPDQGARICSP